MLLRRAACRNLSHEIRVLGLWVHIGVARCSGLEYPRSRVAEIRNRCRSAETKHRGSLESVSLEYIPMCKSRGGHIGIRVRFPKILQSTRRALGDRKLLPYSDCKRNSFKAPRESKAIPDFVRGGMAGRMVCGSGVGRTESQTRSSPSKVNRSHAVTEHNRPLPDGTRPEGPCGSRFAGES